MVRVKEWVEGIAEGGLRMGLIVRRTNVVRFRVVPEKVMLLGVNPLMVKGLPL